MAVPSSKEIHASSYADKETLTLEKGETLEHQWETECIAHTKEEET